LVCVDGQIQVHPELQIAARLHVFGFQMHHSSIQFIFCQVSIVCRLHYYNIEQYPCHRKS
jgi:hypothetical protein